MFINSAEWHLREFKLRRECTDVSNAATCGLRFEHVAVNANPANELRGFGTTLRATYTFAPRLTLQGYAQVFLAGR